MRKELLVALAALSLASAPAFAGKGHGQGKAKGSGRAGGCPPGLARKGNGCLPPGQAKKQYVVGQVLPSAVRVRALTPALVERYGRPPAGYEYVIVDDDVLKLAAGTRLVLEVLGAIR